ncbi:MAG: alkaline phosphatase family protein [Candidatus Babeliales bacterium]
MNKIKFFLFFFFSCNLIIAYNSDHLEIFKKTGECIAGDLSFCDLRSVVNELQKKNIPILLESSNLEGTNFSYSNLKNANFGNTNLASANFECSNLEGANFLLASLEHANFKGASLKYAIFERANLKNTNFEYANLEHANLTDTYGTHHYTKKTTPKVAIILVIDQLGQQTLHNLKPYFTGGFKTFFDNAIIFNNAYWPSSMPATATNHAGLATGTHARNHGIVDNGWIDYNGNEINAAQDNNPCSAVFSPDGVYTFGVSSHYLMVDTLADQIMLQATANKKNKVFCFSHKDRAAALCAGKAGKAVWFDEKAMQFSSSKAYFDTLPAWLKEFNKNHQAPEKNFWHLAYDKSDVAYDAAHDVYAFSRQPALHQTVVAPKNYLKTPHAQALLFELAKTCIDNEYNPDDNLFVMFLSVSTPDKIGHHFTAQSIEYIDILYHLDKEIAEFMAFMHTKADPENIVWLLTADHASMPLIENLQKKGYSSAQRIDKNILKKEINATLEKKFNLKNIIRYIDTPDFYLNHAVFDTLPPKQQKAVINTLKRELKKQPGIKQVWTPRQLQKRYYDDNQFKNHFQNQYFPGRSGDLIIQVYPYTLVGKNMRGTSHKSPYHYDTHVPLMLYQPDSYEKKEVCQKIWVQQITPTLADILNVPAPSSTTFDNLCKEIGSKVK